MPEIECEKCGWQGYPDELIGDRCPECGSDDIVDYED